MEHDERDAYFASRRAFEACGKAIDESVNSHFDGIHLSDGVVQHVLTNFSAERARLVLDSFISMFHDLAGEGRDAEPLRAKKRCKGYPG